MRLGHNPFVLRRHSTAVVSKDEGFQPFMLRDTTVPQHERLFYGVVS
jgi:hypothetical protein